LPLLHAARESVLTLTRLNCLVLDPFLNFLSPLEDAGTPISSAADISAALKP
jgi:hypothetical protein